jgi:hypothetical protein
MIMLCFVGGGTKNKSNNAFHNKNPLGRSILLQYVQAAAVLRLELAQLICVAQRLTSTVPPSARVYSDRVGLPSRTEQRRNVA